MCVSQQRSGPPPPLPTLASSRLQADDTRAQPMLSETAGSASLGHLTQEPPASHGQTLPVLPGSWLQQAGPPPQSGCDSSDCSYCQGLARMRQAGSSGPVCWLRRKRSRTDLAGLGDEAAAAEERGAAKQGRVNNIWDHALAEPSLVDAALECEASGGRRAWSWEADWAFHTAPPPSGFTQLAAFQPPEPPQRRRQTADIVCAVEFEEHGWLIATAGVAKQVRLYSLSSLLENPEQPRWQQPIRTHRMPSKLSSLSWSPDQPGVVTVGDYDGEVSQIDLETGHMVAEADGHAGRRVWSVSHSRLRPHFCASASDDGTVRLWGGPCLGGAVAAGSITPPSRVPCTGVQLSPYDEHTLAVASSDHNVYVYDLRWAQQPLWLLSGHSRAASYVRFLSRGRLVSSSVDSSLAVWDLPGLQDSAAGAAGAAAGSAVASAAVDQPACRCQPFGGCTHGDEGEEARAAAASTASKAGGSTGSVGLHALAGAPVVHPWRFFRGHANSKNFVGLSVRPDDQLLACGSEGPEAFAYCTSWETPLARCALADGPAGRTAAAAPAAGSGDRSSSSPGRVPRSGALAPAGPFCAAVCWQPEAAMGPSGMPLLAAAMSDGELRVIGLQALH